MTLAVLVAGPWSTQAGGTVLALGWIAAVIFGTYAYRGRPPVMVSLTKVAVVFGLISLVLAVLLVYVSLQVRDILAGTIVFGTGGEGCTVVGDGESFVEGQPSYQVAHLSRRVEPGEEVTMRMLQGDVGLAEGSSAGDVAFDCLGTTIDPLPQGTYDVQVVVDGDVLAEGAFEVTLDPA